MSKSIRYFTFLLLVLAVSLFSILPGCKSQSSDSHLGFQVAPRSDEAVLSLYLIPLDASGNITPEHGMLRVKMWEKTGSNPPATGALIGEWDNINMSNLTFSSEKGTMVNLAPNDVFIGKMGQQAYIELDVTDKGKTNATTGIVILGDLPACCGTG